MNRHLFSTVIVVAILTLLTAFTALIVFSSNVQRALAGSGVLTYGALEVYWDRSCTEQIVKINWGVLEPGDAEPVTVFIQNEGTEPLVVTITTTNWRIVTTSDEVTNETEYITFHASNFTLPVNTALPTRWTIEVSENVRFVKSFAFDVIVWG